MAIADLDEIGEPFGEMAIRANLDTATIVALRDLGAFNLSGGEMLRRIAPGPQAVTRSSFRTFCQ